ncbi:hypothetical protein SK128_001300 [Halocaridina rubra]|uniref:Uncharacterized protein n=1 Tax=Halocaridina rubra TaxID=373956 RepID=A0AAN8WQX6_HALRR
MLESASFWSELATGKSLGLEVCEEDVEELVEDLKEELTTDELTELQREDSPRGVITGGREYDFKNLYESTPWRSMADNTYSGDEGSLNQLHIRKSSGEAHLASSQCVVGNQSKRRSSQETVEQDSSSKPEIETPDWEEAGMGWMGSALRMSSSCFPLCNIVVFTCKGNLHLLKQYSRMLDVTGLSRTLFEQILDPKCSWFFV